MTNIFDPEILKFSCHEQSAHFDLMIPENLYYFSGHFPHFPILPGVVQTHWAVMLAHKVYNLPNPTPIGMQVKFQRTLRPGMQVALILDFIPSKERVNFTYRSTQGMHSSGQLRFLLK